MANKACVKRQVEVSVKEKIPQSGEVGNAGGVKIHHAGFYTFVNISRQINGSKFAL